MKLPIALSDDFTQFILFGFGQPIDIDTVKQALGQNFLHQVCFIEAFACSSPAI